DQILRASRAALSRRQLILHSSLRPPELNHRACPAAIRRETLGSRPPKAGSLPNRLCSEFRQTLAVTKRALRPCLHEFLSHTPRSLHPLVVPIHSLFRVPQQ